jgi:hypothetical protein
MYTTAAFNGPRALKHKKKLYNRFSKIIPKGTLIEGTLYNNYVSGSIFSYIREGEGSGLTVDPSGRGKRVHGLPYMRYCTIYTVNTWLRESDSVFIILTLLYAKIMYNIRNLQSDVVMPKSRTIDYANLKEPVPVMIKLLIVRVNYSNGGPINSDFTIRYGRLSFLFCVKKLDTPISEVLTVFKCPFNQGSSLAVVGIVGEYWFLFSKWSQLAPLKWI